MPPGISDALDQIPLSHQTLRNVSRAFRRDARREELTPKKAELFEAWTLAFVSWCAGRDVEGCGAGQVRACQIGEFQVALRGRPETTHREAVVAMDALAFLFGAAEETKSALRSAGFSVENGEKPAPPSSAEETSSADTTDRSQARRTFPGWPDKEERTGPSAFQESTTSNRDSIFHPEPQEDDSSTAKDFVRAFNSKVESMHDSDPGSSTRMKGKMQSARAA